MCLGCSALESDLTRRFGCALAPGRRANRIGGGGAVDDLGDRSKDPLPTEGNQLGETRRDFLKKAAVAGLSLPVAGAIVGAAAARPSIIVRDRARSRFEGVTLQFAKAPFGTDEKDVIAKLLKPFEAKTGMKVQHTIVPWNVEGASYATNYAGPESVRRQLPDQYRSDVTRDEGCPRGAEHQAVAVLARLRLDRREVHPQHDQEEHLPGQALRPAVHHRWHRHVLQQGPARQGRRDQDPH